MVNEAVLTSTEVLRLKVDLNRTTDRVHHMSFLSTKAKSVLMLAKEHLVVSMISLYVTSNWRSDPDQILARETKTFC